MELKDVGIGVSSVKIDAFTVKQEGLEFAKQKHVHVRLEDGESQNLKI